jgi:hypothetical protein
MTMGAAARCRHADHTYYMCMDIDTGAQNRGITGTLRSSQMRIHLQL